MAETVQTRKTPVFGSSPEANPEMSRIDVRWTFWQGSCYTLSYQNILNCLVDSLFRVKHIHINRQIHFQQNSGRVLTKPPNLCQDPFQPFPIHSTNQVDLWNLQCRSMEVQWSHLQQSPAASPEALCRLVCKVRAPDLSSTWKRLACVICHISSISISQKQKISRYHLHLPFSMDGSSRLCCSGNLPIISQLAPTPLMVLKAVLPTPARHKQAPPRWQEAPIAGYIGSKPHGWIPWGFFWVFSVSKNLRCQTRFRQKCQKSCGLLQNEAQRAVKPQKSFVSPPSATMGPP